MLISISDDLYFHALESAATSIVITDKDSVIVYVNQRFEQTTEYSAEEAIGRNCKFLQIDGAGIYDRDQPDLDRLRESIALGESCEVVLRNYTRSGELFLNQLHVAPIRNRDGQVTHFVGVQKDITEAVYQAEKAKQLEIQNQIKMQLMNIMANLNHEFRHPLANISTYVYLAEAAIKEDQPSDEPLNRLVTIRHHIENLSYLLDRTALLCSLLADKEPVLSQHNIYQVITSIGMDMREKNEAIAIDIAFQEALMNYEVEGTNLLRLAFNELIQNVIDHNHGETQIMITCDLVTQHYVLIKIQDNGIGIPESSLQTIFEAYYRGDLARQLRYPPNFGLGLTIAKHIIEQSGGEIWVDSERGENTTVNIQLLIHSS